MSALLLGACEAPLTLDGVQRERERAVRRYDRLQAAATNGESIVVAGNAGLVLVSSDGGRNWMRHILPGRPALIAAAACSGGYVLLDFDRRVWHSEGAVSWQPQALDTPEPPMALTCDPAGRLWVIAGFSTILHSEDNGRTWHSTDLGEDVLLTAIQFLDEDTGFIVGEFGTVLATTDGGASWERRSVIPGDFYPHAAWFTDAETGWVVGLKGALYHTSDGGASWSLQGTDTEAALFGLAELGRDIYAVGGNGTILRLQGTHWVTLPLPDTGRSWLRAALPVEDDRWLLLAGGNSLDLFVPPQG